MLSFYSKNNILRKLYSKKYFLLIFYKMKVRIYIFFSQIGRKVLMLQKCQITPFFRNVMLSFTISFNINI